MPPEPTPASGTADTATPDCAEGAVVTSAGGATADASAQATTNRAAEQRLGARFTTLMKRAVWSLARGVRGIEQQTLQCAAM